MKKHTVALLCICATYIIFGFSFMFSALALEVASPSALLAVRFIVAFVALSGVILTGKFPFSLKGKPVGMLLAMGVFQPILYFFCENYGIYLTSSAFSGTIIALVPVVSLVLAYVFLKEIPTKLQTLCAFVSVFGVYLTTLGSDGGNVNLLGFFLLVVAVFSTCLYNIISKKASEHFNPLEKTYVQMMLGCIVFPTMFLIQNHANLTEALWVPLTSGKFWIAIIYLSILSSIGAFMLLNYAISYVSVTQAAILSNLVTVISIFAGVIFLKEAFSFTQVIGAVIIILSVYGVTVPTKKKD